MTDAPDDYWCSVPELKELNLTTNEIKILSIPIITVNIRSNYMHYRMQQHTSNVYSTPLHNYQLTLI